MKTSINNKTDKAYLLFFSIITIYICFILGSFIDIKDTTFSSLGKFNTVFISILLQAIPFVLIGTLVSSLLNEFISEEFIARVFPKKRIPSYLAAIGFGLLFPICDCAIVPVASRLVKKGVPVSSAVMFMLCAPIINPVVIASTLYAFPDSPMVACLRVALGIFISIAVGESLNAFGGSFNNLFTANTLCSCGHSHEHHNSHNVNNKKSFYRHIMNLFSHMGEEFFNVGKFLIIGAFISAIFQSYVTAGLWGRLNLGILGELLIMMASGFVLSVCSTSDAFIAKGFLTNFSIMPVIGFMVLGPMIDIKNTLMLAGSFPKKQVAGLVAVIFLEAFIILFFTASLFGVAIAK